MTGIDTNVLVALAVQEHPSHSQAIEVFDRELAAGEEIALSISIAAEFLHVVTDPRRITPAREMTFSKGTRVQPDSDCAHAKRGEAKKLNPSRTRVRK